MVGPESAGGRIVVTMDRREALPLEGVRVLDFSLLLPGPACTARLAWLGADVVKVEPPGGDPARHLYGGALWDLFNRGKRSVVLNLKEADEQRRLDPLVRASDVVVESFRPGVADRLGFGHQRLRSVKEDLIHCSLTGFGENPSIATRPAHDLIFLAMSGALGAPGSWRGRGGPPTRPLVPLADLAAADAAVQSILAALLRRARGGTGARLVISAFAAALHAAALRAGPALLGERLPDPAPHLDPANDLYETADGRYVAIAAVEDHFWRSLCELLDLGSPLGAEAMRWSWRERQREGESVAAAIGAACRNRAAEDLVADLDGAGVPVAVVRSLEEAFGDPAVPSEDAVQEGWVRPPLPFDGWVGRAPALGEHTDELLAGREPEPRRAA